MNATALRIRRAAMNCLAKREFGQIELMQKLQARFEQSDLIEAVVTQLNREGLQSDDRFIASFVYGKQLRGQGPVRIAAELKLRHISSDAIASQVDSHHQLWFDLAVKVYHKKYPHLINHEAKQRAQCSRFLQYRGFTYEQITYALNHTAPPAMV